jgi:hypothetical protein
MIRFSRFRRGDHPDPTAPETEGLQIMCIKFFPHLLSFSLDI